MDAHGRTVLCQKDPGKGYAVQDHHRITYLPLTWKLLTGVIVEEMKLLPEEQNGCRRESRGIKDQFLIDKTVLKDCKKIHTNSSMAWIDYKKAYDVVPHSCISECMELFGIPDNVRNVLEKSMEQ